MTSTSSPSDLSPSLDWPTPLALPSALMPEASSKEKNDSTSSHQRPMSVTIITLFPEMYPGPLGISLIGKALLAGLWSLKTINLRHYGLGRYGAVDDTCYGGGAGMVIRPDVVHSAVKEALLGLENPRFVYMTPRGTPMAQSHFNRYGQSNQDLVIVCGRYEGVDQRVLDFWKFDEISLGDFVLCGGDIPAMALIEGCVRLLPGVVHNPESTVTESFQCDLLEHPQYTRPQEWQGMTVPDVLLSGHHRRIQQWQKDQSSAHTQVQRPDLWARFRAKNSIED
jgi:tRNA (guanine37-N1)-methyltransferase